VALAVHLRLAQTIAVRSPERAAQMLVEQADAACVAIEILSSLSRGIYPRLLSDEGLVPALRSAVADSPLAVSIEANGVGPLPQPIATALYFCCMEAVQNAAKHSGANSMLIHMGEDQDRWRLSITDNGSGFDQVRVRADGACTGLANMHDRLDAVGGSLDIASRSGLGTTITAIVLRTEGVEASRTPIPVASKAV
jgi:signal transduction histidine kinase